jgi:hypothetical protein
MFSEARIAHSDEEDLPCSASSTALARLIQYFTPGTTAWSVAIQSLPSAFQFPGLLRCQLDVLFSQAVPETLGELDALAWGELTDIDRRCHEFNVRADNSLGQPQGNGIRSILKQDSCHFMKPQARLSLVHRLTNARHKCWQFLGKDPHAVSEVGPCSLTRSRYSRNVPIT